MVRGAFGVLVSVVALSAACGSPSVTDVEDGRFMPPTGDTTPSSDPGASPTPQGTPCAVTTKVVIWGLRQWDVLADSFEGTGAACTEYYISLPPVACDPVAGKICPRGPLAPEEIRAHGSNFHAMAEFHWGSWSKWVAATGRTWEDAGKEFRKKMVDANYDIAAGDTWALNELPSTVRSGEGPARVNSMNAVRGLHSGPAGALPSLGTVFTTGMGQQTVNFSVYKANLKGWLTDASYWQTMNGRVRFWAQETYTDPQYVCVPGSTVGLRSKRTNEFTQHLARLAAAAPSAGAEARDFFDDTYVPLMNASWQQEGTGLGTTTIPAAEMADFVALQVYAGRAWSNTHVVPDRRVGFAWAPAAGVTAPELVPIAQRMATSVRDAYVPGNGAVDACNPAGTLSGCQCEVAGAKFSSAWETFATY